MLHSIAYFFPLVACGFVCTKFAVDLKLCFTGSTHMKILIFAFINLRLRLGLCRITWEYLRLNSTVLRQLKIRRIGLKRNLKRNRMRKIHGLKNGQIWENFPTMIIIQNDTRDLEYYVYQQMWIWICKNAKKNQKLIMKSSNISYCWLPVKNLDSVLVCQSS